MLTSISPLGERARGHRWGSTVAWLCAGGLLGGALTMGAVAAAGAALPGRVDSPARLVVLAVAAVAAGVWDLGGGRFPGRRQVNEDWMVDYRSWVYGLGFGVQLGAGVMTMVTTALVPLLLLVVVLVDDVMVGAALGAVFGATRGLTVLATRRARSTADLVAIHRRFDGLQPAVRLAGGTVAFAVGATAAIAAIGVGV
ncbi:MAG: hypothetical protein ACE5GB_10235 [Acidimicrobiales bacterium]